MELAEFYKYIEYEKRYSPNTLISYQNDLQQFADFLKSEYESLPALATSVQIRSWLSDLMTRGFSKKRKPENFFTEVFLQISGNQQ